MPFKSILSCLLALVSGTAAGAVIKVGYTLPGVLPTSDLYTYIITSPLGLVAIDATSGKAGFMIAVLMRAFPWSFVVGAIAGVVLHKFSCQRIFCCSALWLPLANVILGQFSLWEASTSSSEYLPVIQKVFDDLLWVNFSVYGWYFLALVLSFAISKRFMHKKAAQRTGPDGPAADLHS